MTLIFRPFILRADLQQHRSWLFVFGDNLAQYGPGGQAKEMRGEPNAIGLPTKRSPYIYLTNEDLPGIKIVTRRPLAQLEAKLASGGVVIWPQAGIGTGLARLHDYAPKVEDFYIKALAKLRRVAAEQEERERR